MTGLLHPGRTGGGGGGWEGMADNTSRTTPRSGVGDTGLSDPVAASWRQDVEEPLRGRSGESCVDVGTPRGNRLSFGKGPVPKEISRVRTGSPLSDTERNYTVKGDRKEETHSDGRDCYYTTYELRRRGGDNEFQVSNGQGPLTRPPGSGPRLVGPCREWVGPNGSVSRVGVSVSRAGVYQERVRVTNGSVS